MRYLAQARASVATRITAALTTSAAMQERRSAEASCPRVGAVTETPFTPLGLRSSPVPPGPDRPSADKNKPYQRSRHAEQDGALDDGEGQRGQVTETANKPEDSASRGTDERSDHQDPPRHGGQTHAHIVAGRGTVCAVHGRVRGLAGQNRRVSDWAFDFVLALVALGLLLSARRLWQRGRTQVAVAVAIPVPFLVLLEALMIWYTVTGGGGDMGM